MRQVNKLLGCLLLTLLSGSSCRQGAHGPLAAADYARYIEDPEHGMSRTITSGMHEYVIQLAPSAYMLSKELADADSSYVVAKRMKELSGYTFFLVRIGTTAAYRQAAGGQEQDRRVRDADAQAAYYSQAAAADLVLRCGDRVLQPATYHFENNYGLTPYNTIVAGFETGTAPADLQLSFNDRFSGVAGIRAAFTQSDLAALPALQTDEASR